MIKQNEMGLKIKVQVKEMEFKGIKVGTLVEPHYHKGFWEVVSVNIGGLITQDMKDKHYRWHSSINVGDKFEDAMITIKKMYETDGNPAKRKRKLIVMGSQVFKVDAQRIHNHVSGQNNLILAKQKEIAECTNTIARLETMKQSLTKQKGDAVDKNKDEEDVQEGLQGTIPVGGA